jgi:hypothetical protein
MVAAAPQLAPWTLDFLALAILQSLATVSSEVDSIPRPRSFTALNLRCDRVQNAPKLAPWALGRLFTLGSHRDSKDSVEQRRRALSSLVAIYLRAWATGVRREIRPKVAVATLMPGQECIPRTLSSPGGIRHVTNYIYVISVWVNYRVKLL